MPVVRSSAVLEVVRGIKVFLNIEGGATRGRLPNHGAAIDVSPKLKQAEEQLARQRQALEAKDRRISQLEARMAGGTSANGADGIAPGNIVWVFGHGRSGSTWLSRVIGELEDHTVWFEPSVGEIFGRPYYEARAAQRRSKIFVLGDGQRETWIKSMRFFVLEGASGRFPNVGEGILLVKEPHGSMGAPLLMEALPESRMILLFRDPRDAVASALDAFKKGNWGHERTREDNLKEVTLATERPEEFVADKARTYLQGVGRAWEAYKAHAGRKSLVRYEDLRADTMSVMRRIYSELEIPVDDEKLVRAVEKHSWENIPKDERGEGKFYRKATPGSWREDLTPRQIEIVEEITAPLLAEFYPA